jgi:hypothetical protein
VQHPEISSESRVVGQGGVYPCLGKKNQGSRSKTHKVRAHLPTELLANGMTDDSSILIIVDLSMEHIHHQLIDRKGLRAGNGGYRMDAISTL